LEETTESGEDYMMISLIIFLMENTTGKRPLGRPRHRSEYHIKEDHKVIWWEAVDRIFLAQGGDKR